MIITAGLGCYLFYHNTFWGQGDKSVMVHRQEKVTGQSMELVLLNHLGALENLAINISSQSSSQAV